MIYVRLIKCVILARQREGAINLKWRSLSFCSFQCVSKLIYFLFELSNGNEAA